MTILQDLYLKGNVKRWRGPEGREEGGSKREGERGGRRGRGRGGGREGGEPGSRCPTLKGLFCVYLYISLVIFLLLFPVGGKGGLVIIVIEII